ncbi:TPA: hypothetical protein N0F65_001531 [Lagenidium giganteum]|uniref:HECT-type E3 ubiquitin transferase n=1 Tax=Lagenidium giganteum TaxID=4803 RepID=A0AAV2Z1Q7_9STRA|nr:TPA: hypothetical protein N0F65_001531 [Lagenidium giganteum]
MNVAMFQRDADLRKAGGKDRSALVAEARRKREARAAEREACLQATKVQSFVHGRAVARKCRRLERADFDAKLVDIQKLKGILQMPHMPLPVDTLFDLMRKALWFFNGDAADQARFLLLAGLVLDSVRAAADQWNSQFTGQREFQLKRFIDIALQTTQLPAGEGDPKSQATTFAVIDELAKTCDGCALYLCSNRLCVFSVSKLPARPFTSLPRSSLLGIVRTRFVMSYSTSGSTAPKFEAYNAKMMVFLITLLDSNRISWASFVHEILSLHLLNQQATQETFQLLTSTSRWDSVVQTTIRELSLPATPTPGIASATWLLGNLLWLSDRVSDRTSSSTLSEVLMLTKILNWIPAEAYSTDGVTVSWTKVTGAHSVPVVYPEALLEQLETPFRERYLRKLMGQLLIFAPDFLQHPLETSRPVPMFPSAPTVAEQFGFGDIATAPTNFESLKATWRKVKSFRKPRWALRLLEKTGLRRGNHDDEDEDGSDFTSAGILPNTSMQARALATEGKEVAKKRAVAASSTLGGKAYVLEHVQAFARFCMVFLCRWGTRGKKKRHLGVMRLLNTLAFSYITLEQGSEECSTVHWIYFLWSVLQDWKSFEAFTKDVNLVRVKITDGYVCVLGLFCLTYNHMLLVLDDAEMYEKEFPLPLHQVERIVKGLKDALYAAYWFHGMVQDSAATAEPAEFGLFVIDAATQLLRNLYSRCSRSPFCNVTSWVVADLDVNQLISEVLAGTPRANKFITEMPYGVPFPDRVRLFQSIVQADKVNHQGEGTIVYRIRIRRGAFLEDGLRKLNAIKSDMKKRINVIFINEFGTEETGIDAGGLFKEFWLDLSNYAFDLQYGLFELTLDQLLYPNPASASAHFDRPIDHLTLFQFVGRILGKALYEGIVVQPKFAHFFLSKLLHAYNNLNELPSLDPEIYKNLVFLKSYDGDISDLGLTHTVVQEVFGEQKEVEIIPGGANIPVTNQNKTRYIHLVADYYLNVQIREQSAAFRAGLADVIDLRWLQMFNEPELQVLISGKGGHLDIEDLRAHTMYTGGYYALDKRVGWLWQALASFTPSEQAAFLRFTTSCQRAPSLGFGALTPPFCVQKIPIRRDDELLPSSSTCFNTLKLPTYSSYKVLREKLLTAVTSGAGFEMTNGGQSKQQVPSGFFDDEVADAKAQSIDLKQLAKQQLEKDWEEFEEFAAEVEKKQVVEEEAQEQEIKERDAEERLENMEYMDRYRQALEKAMARNKKQVAKEADLVPKEAEMTAEDAAQVGAVAADDIKANIRKRKRAKPVEPKSSDDEEYDPCNWRSKKI